MCAGHRAGPAHHPGGRTLTVLGRVNPEHDRCEGLLDGPERDGPNGLSTVAQTHELAARLAAGTHGGTLAMEALG